MAYNILVVDDSTVMRGIILKTLRLSGLSLGTVHEASDAETGLRLLSDHPIDLALVDINMPGMNGEDMIARIRSNPKTATLKVIVVSTEGSQTRIDRLKSQGTGFVHKPFTPEDLRQVVFSLLPNHPK